VNINEIQLKRASRASLASVLNLTFLPVVGFIILFQIYKITSPDTIDRYYSVVGIKTNIFAAIALVLVTGLMFLTGGFYSPWTWVYVISYFVFVHALFILFATWTLVRSWTGEKLKKNFLTK